MKLPIWTISEKAFNDEFVWGTYPAHNGEWAIEQWASEQEDCTPGDKMTMVARCEGKADVEATILWTFNITVKKG